MTRLTSFPSYDLLKSIGRIADKYSIQAFVIGGFVRDIFLGRQSYDIDIVCLHDSIFLADKISQVLHFDNLVIYKTFGTAMIKKDNLQIEFVNTRKESYSYTSRNPVVINGTFQDDQQRRDFTINTLAIGLNENNFGEIINTMHGLEDLNNKIIRTPIDPGKTFCDDPLRMLRAIRFATQLGFTISPETFEAIIEQKERIKIITKERIRDEINKILSSPQPSIGFQLLYNSGILDIIMPYIAKLNGKIQIESFSHKDIFLHTLQVVDNVSRESDNIWLRWAALLHDIAKPQTKKFDPKYGFSFHGHEIIGARMVKNIFYDLHLPKNKIKYIEKLIRLHLRPIAIAQDIVSDSGVRRLAFDAGEELNDLMLLCKADITSHNSKKVMEYMDNFKKVEMKIKAIEAKDNIRNLQPILNGEEIMKKFNLPPGPKVGQIKTLLKTAIINGEVKNTYEDLLYYLDNILKIKV